MAYTTGESEPQALVENAVTLIDEQALVGFWVNLVHWWDSG